MMSKESLLKLARSQHYKPEILEKVLRLLQVLQQFMAVPYLRDRFVLKGGTALNLFQFDNVPRLSVDIDLNYVGSLDRATMLQERIVINEAIEKILEQNQFEHYRSPGHHAGDRHPARAGDDAVGQSATSACGIPSNRRSPRAVQLRSGRRAGGGSGCEQRSRRSRCAPARAVPRASMADEFPAGRAPCRARPTA